MKDLKTWRNQYWNLNKIKSYLNIKQQRRFGQGLIKQTVEQEIFIEKTKVFNNSQQSRKQDRRDWPIRNTRTIELIIYLSEYRD